MQYLKSSPMVKNIIIVAIVLIVLTVVYKLYQASKEAASILGEAGGGIIIQQQTGITIPRQQICLEVAKDIREAMTILPFVETIVWITDDEVVTSLNRLVSANEAALCSVKFKAITGKSLLNDVVNNTGFFTNKSRINPDLIPGIK